jgi:cyclophilin family peptidyl-prolyl cis-trans isomerase
MKNKLAAFLFLLLVILFSCKPNPNKSTVLPEEYSREKGSYQQNIKGVVTIETYDHYSRLLKSGFGFYIASNRVVTNLDLVKGSFKVKVAPTGSQDYSDVAGYTAYSMEKNLVILKVWNQNPNYLKLQSAVKNIPDSVAGLYRKSRKLFAPKFAVGEKVVSDSITTYSLNRSSYSGIPAFTFLHHLVGMVQTKKMGIEKESVLIPASEIAKLYAQDSKSHTSVYELRTKTNKVYPSFTSIKGFRIKTTMGDVEIQLYNETPVFRDNFIKLVSDQFYDSLLVHRVLKDFLIQTGAADSKYAKKDDVVGWQGPGYMLKTKIAKGTFHKRGAVAMSKLPESRNPKNLTDGSQFYIVSGRVFTDEEMDDISKDRGVKFNAQQRKIYTTVGGAPHLDGEYVVFGEVVSGMEVVDKIAAVETYGEDRPVKNIRIMKIEIIQR